MASTQAQGFENRKAEEARRLLRTPEIGDADIAPAFEAQRVYGNHALSGGAAPAPAVDPASIVRRARLVVQPKLTLGPVDDVYEREADSVAAQVVQAMAAPQAQAESGGAAIQRQEEEDELQMKPVAEVVQRQEEEDELQMKPVAEVVQRQEEEDELQMKPVAEVVQRQEEEDELQMKPVAEVVQRQEEEEELQMKSADGAPDATAVDPAIESQIQRARSGGSALEPGARGSMEGAMGTDFSSVRVHTGQESDSLNRSLSARAFTTGSDIFFRSGEYNPGTTQGQELLAHELTHVVQQGAAVRTKRMAPDVQRKRAARDVFFGATFA